MSTDLSKVYHKLKKAIEVNFPSPLVIDGTIEAIINDNFFLVRSVNGDNVFFQCWMNSDRSNFREKDRVIIKGKLTFDPALSNTLYIATEYMHLFSEKEKINNAINIYKRLQKTLATDRCQQMINKIKSVPAPQTISTVALIVPGDDGNNLENFKMAFQEKCLGKLLLVRLSNNICSLENVVEGLKKYQVDLVCVLAEQAPVMRVCEQSSENNVRYLINRNLFAAPYIVSIVPSVETLPGMTDKITMEPLTTVLSNARMIGINACIDFIHQIQLSYKNHLETNILKGKEILQKIIDKQKRKLLSHKIGIADLVDSQFMVKTNDILLDKLKHLLIQKLQQEKHKLSNIKISLMESILDDAKIINTIRSADTQVSVQIKRRAEDCPVGCVNNNQKKIENKIPDNIRGDICINIKRNNGDFE